MTTRTVHIYLRGRKKPLILSDYLVFDSSEDDRGFGERVYGLNRKGEQQHFLFDNIVKMETHTTKRP